MASSTGADRQPRPGSEARPLAVDPATIPADASRWRQVFGGDERQLGVMRQWIKSLLPDCPARDDVIAVAAELGSNALLHTASGHGGGFAVELTWHPPLVRVAVADRGGPVEPRVIAEPDGERGRGLFLVYALSARTGCEGDQRGRLVWAEIPWGDAATPTSASPQAVSC